MPLMRGAILSPRHVLAAARPHISAVVPPPSFFRLAKAPLPFFGNDRYGCCVTSEEYSAKAADGRLGTDAEAIASARRWHGLNGADLSTILDYAASGFTVNGETVKDGDKQSVNYTDWAALCAGIYQGQIKIATGSNAIESAGAGQNKPWVLPSCRMEGIDHCTGLAGYGTFAECCNAIGWTKAVDIGDATPSVVLESWGSYGAVAYTDALLPFMDSTPGKGQSEAWLRVPTTVGDSPVVDPNIDPGPAPQINPALAIPGTYGNPSATSFGSGISYTPAPCPNYGHYDRDGNPMWDDVAFPPERRLR